MDVQLPDGTIIKDVPDGTTKADLAEKLKSNGMAVPSEWLSASKPEPAMSQKAGAELNGIPRQIGLTARYGLEGLAQGAQIITEPIRYMTDKLTPERANAPKSLPLSMVASNVADWIGLPKPQNANERVIGEATKLGFGSGGMTAAAKAAQALPGLAGTAGAFLAANPAAQVASAAGAGLAGGASREAGGTGLEQAGAAVLGGVVGGLAPGGVNAAVSAAKRLLAPSLSNSQLDKQISVLLNRSGVDYSQIPERVRQSLRADAANALNAGQELSPAALARLADFRATGTTPTRGMLTLDPVQLTKEQNLAKMAANSSDGALHGLPMVQNQNNNRLIQALNETGANRGNVDAAGNLVVNSVMGRQAALRGAEQSAWNEAKNSPGYTQPISSAVISDMNAALGNEGLMPFMNPTISRYMEAFQTGQPFTPQAYRNLQSMLAREISKGGNEGAAAGLARRVLEQSELRPVGFANEASSLATPRMAAVMRAADQNAAQSIEAVNSARAATRNAYAYEDSSPLVRSVLSGGATSDPQRIAQRFVIGGTAQEAADLAQQVGPQGFAEIKNALVLHLKERALNRSADEVGKFSQSAYNKALQDLDRSGKLRLFFSADEVGQLRSMGRAASYMQAQPVGSAVNNSNSGALLLGKGSDALRGLLGKVPGGQQFLLDPIKNIEVSIGNRSAQNVGKGLLVPTEGQPTLYPSLLGTGVAMGGLLSPQMVNDR